MPRWILAFLDRPAAAFDDAARFWTAVTDTHLSARRGSDGEFATFLPTHGDACLKLQGVRDGGGVHLDLEFDDPLAAIATAETLGASAEIQSGPTSVKTATGNATRATTTTPASPSAPTAPA
jgi:hypothetical protein